METTEIKAMLSHCDELTRNGKRLSIIWSGGSDSGLFNLQSDGEVIETPTPIEQEIIQFIEYKMGYESFNGDFSTEGELAYDRDKKCFTGLDSYSETEENLLSCAIEIDIPDNIWFDDLLLSVVSEDDGERIHARLSLRILNGLHPADFDTIQGRIEMSIRDSFCELISDIDDFAGIWEEYTLPRAGFQLKDGMLRYTITSFSYSCYASEIREIKVSFND
jgi:hypothetical protein